MGVLSSLSRKMISMAQHARAALADSHGELAPANVHLDERGLCT